MRSTTLLHSVCVCMSVCLFLSVYLSLSLSLCLHLPVSYSINQMKFTEWAKALKDKVTISRPGWTSMLSVSTFRWRAIWEFVCSVWCVTLSFLPWSQLLPIYRWLCPPTRWFLVAKVPWPFSGKNIPRSPLARHSFSDYILILCGL